MENLNEFLNLHQQHNQFTQDNLLAYLARMVQLNFAPKTIIDEVSLIQKQLIIENLPDITQGPRVALFLAGLKKIKTELKQKDIRLPITIDILQAICDNIVYITNSDYHAQLYRAMFLLAFHCLLRIGEITHRTEKPLKAQPYILVEDIIVERDKYLTLYITNAKTAKGNIKQPTRCYELSGDYCPYYHLLKYLEMRENRTGHLFVELDGTRVKRNTFANILEQTICFSRFSQHNYKPHSFRIGGATHLALQGATEQEIMKRGRWSTRTYGLH